MTTAYENLPPRAKSQRVINKTEKMSQYEEQKQQQQQHHHQHAHQHHHHNSHQHHHVHERHDDEQEPTPQQLIQDQQMHHTYQYQQQRSIEQDVYPGLNDIADAFEAFPQELVRYFTLLKEIDAKCVYTVPFLKAYIKRFLAMDPKHPKRQELLFKIRSLIKELMPSLEEKMHVASLAVDTVQKHVARIEDDYDEIVNNNEIPESIRIGPLNHPAMIMEFKLDNNGGSNASKSAQSQRSESRREALAAKKALNINAPLSQLDEDMDTPGPGTTPGAQSSTSSKKRKPPANSSRDNNNQTTNNTGTSSSRKRRPPASGVSGGGNGNAVGGGGGGNGAGARSPAAPSSSSSTAAHGNYSSTHHHDLNSSRPQTPVTTIVATNTAVPLPSVQQLKAKKPAGSAGKIQVHVAAEEDNLQEAVYCYCQQVSFGEMVGCDGDNCKREWFHLPCIGLTDPPKGKWYCNDCLAKLRRGGSKR